MSKRKPVMILLLTVICLTGAAAPAAAEWFADLYVGPAFTQDHDFTLSQRGFTSKALDVNFADAVSFGGRAGYWFESTPYVGLALDVSHFQPDMDRQKRTNCVTGPLPDLYQITGCYSGTEVYHIDVAVTGISFDAMARWPLFATKEIPKGRLQPYLTVGPTIFVSRAKDSWNLLPQRQSETDTSIGVKAGAGVAWQFHRYVALFGEYRFTHFAPKFDFKNLSAEDFVSTVSSPLKTDLNTHRAVFGVSFRY